MVDDPTPLTGYFIPSDQAILVIVGDESPVDSRRFGLRRDPSYRVRWGVVSETSLFGYRVALSIIRMRVEHPMRMPVVVAGKGDPVVFGVLVRAPKSSDPLDP